MSRLGRFVRNVMVVAIAAVMVVDFPVQALNNKYDASAAKKAPK